MPFIIRTVATVAPCTHTDFPMNLELSENPEHLIITLNGDANEYNLNDIYDALNSLKQWRKDEDRKKDLAKLAKLNGGLINHA